MVKASTKLQPRGMNGNQKTTGANFIASTQAPLLTFSVNRASPFSLSTSTINSKNVMAASAFMPPATGYRPIGSQPYAPLSTAVGSYDRSDTTKPTPVGTPFASSHTSILIRRLPVNTSEEQLRLMMVWADDLLDVDVLPVEQSDDASFRSAVCKFRTPNGAHKARDMLDGKMNFSKDAEMAVEILPGGMTSSRGFPGEDRANGPGSTTSSNGSSSQPSRQPSRFNGAFPPMGKLSPPLSTFSGTELPNPETSTHYQSLFSPQSPIGNHLSERTRITGKSLITNDSADDDETGELLKDPLAYAENDANTTHRRQVAPQIPLHRMAGLSLNTSSPGPSMQSYSHHGMTPLSGHSSHISPVIGPGPMYPMNPHYGRHTFPPVNPADQNPPCNTLYVGNLPADTSEEELKAMFSKQRGYKRLCFRTKQNGPMCFVEFEDVSFATKALHELYGHPLHNSVKGGIRLSFSKNPLGVRSGQNPNNNNGANINGLGSGISGTGNGFSTASGPPPGLAAPQGLSMNRIYGGGHGGLTGNVYHSNGYSNSSSPWNNSYNGNMSTGSPSPMIGGGGLSSSFPAHMMGR